MNALYQIKLHLGALVREIKLGHPHFAWHFAGILRALKN